MKTPILKSYCGTLLATMFIFTGLSSLSAQDQFYLRANQTDPSQWNLVNAAQGWHTLPSGDLIQATAMDNTAYYYTNGFNLRSPSGNTPFGGARLTLDATLLMRNNQTANHVQAVHGSTFSVGDNNLRRLTVTLFEQSGTTTYVTSTSNARGHGLIYSTLTGNGTMQFNGLATASPFLFDIADATGYSGEFMFNQGTFSFDQNLSSAASLTISGTSIVNLTHAIAVTSLNINGDNLGAGTYNYSYLNTNYGSIFTSGSFEDGMITVVPEPSAYALIVGTLLLGGIMLRRRMMRS